MARSFTVAQLVTAAKQRADMENNDFIGAAEWISMCSASYTRLYNKLVQAGLYFKGTQTITPDGSSDYALPADYFRTVRVDYMDGDSPVPLKPISVREQHRLEGPTGQSVGYLLAGQNLELYPAPTSGTYRHIYIPAPANLDADDDAVDGVSGWEEIIILDMAVKARIKEESEAGTLRAERDTLMAEIDEQAMHREWGEPLCISDSDARSPEEGDFVQRGVRSL